MEVKVKFSWSTSISKAKKEYAEGVYQSWQAFWSCIFSIDEHTNDILDQLRKIYILISQIVFLLTPTPHSNYVFA